MTFSKAAAWALLADVVCVLALALGGRDAHNEGSSTLVLLRIAWPFLVATLVATVLLAWRRFPAHALWPAGVTAWLVTYVLGMALRGLSGRGLAPGFLVVALLFLALTMLGWRLLVLVWNRVRRTA